MFEKTIMIVVLETLLVLRHEERETSTHSAEWRSRIAIETLEIHGVNDHDRQTSKCIEHKG